MGLDMYLTKKIYIGAEYEHRNVKGSINITIDGNPVDIDFNKISYIEQKAGYWRKANQIHKWFVENIQDGQDDCGEYSLSKEKATELLQICQTIKSKCKLKKGKVHNGTTYSNGVETEIIEDGKTMSNPEIAGKLLPTASGFFFGSTDYDQYYMQDIEKRLAYLSQYLQPTTRIKIILKTNIIIAHLGKSEADFRLIQAGANWQQQKDKTVIEQAFHLLQWAHKVITANVPKQAGYGAIEILPEIEQLLNQLK